MKSHMKLSCRWTNFNKDCMVSISDKTHAKPNSKCMSQIKAKLAYQNFTPHIIKSTK
jgi:hypothetical protein